MKDINVFVERAKIEEIVQKWFTEDLTFADIGSYYVIKSRLCRQKSRDYGEDVKKFQQYSVKSVNAISASVDYFLDIDSTQ